MPLGHAAMILMNRHMPGYLGWGAAGLIATGMVLLTATRFTASQAWQSFWGTFAGVFLWTGAVEYGLYFGANALGVESRHGTAGEYLLLEHSWGFLLLLLLYLVFHEGVRCDLMVWLRRRLHLTRGPAVNGRVGNYGPRTAFEMVAVLWFFYVVLLLLFDDTVFGVHHPATYAALVVSLGFGIWLFYRLARIKEMGRALRYAIPTVVLLWNGVEITAKWGLYTEPWKVIHWPTLVAIAAGMAVSVRMILTDLRKTRPSS